MYAVDPMSSCLFKDFATLSLFLLDNHIHQLILIFLLRSCDSGILSFFFLIEIYLIYSIVLVSGIQQSDSVMYVCVYIYIYFRLFSITGYYKILNIVPCAIQ